MAIVRLLLIRVPRCVTRACAHARFFWPIGRSIARGFLPLGPRRRVVGDTPQAAVVRPALAGELAPPCRERDRIPAIARLTVVALLRQCGGQ